MNIIIEHVICAFPIFTFFTYAPPLPDPGLNCSNGEVRLVNGDVDSGRVEVCVGGMWSTVCADINWDDREARTICRQLGYTNLSGEPTACKCSLKK